MAYITDILHNKIEIRNDRITIEKYIIENSYITKYLSKIIKDKAISIYHVLFHLSYFETGKGEIVIPWSEIGSYIVSEQGNIIEDGSTIKRRIPELITKKCIVVNRQRGGANEIIVKLPSEIPECKVLIDANENEFIKSEEDSNDYYTDPERRLSILSRDKNKCIYCLIDISEDNYCLDHLIPIVKGGSNKKHNLVSSCENCNQRKQDTDVFQFLLENYRSHLISQPEYLNQKNYIEELINKQ